MPTGCCVPQCTNQIGGHTFPIDKKLKKLWIGVIRRQTRDPQSGRLVDWQPTKYSVICTAHFIPTDYKDGDISKKKRRLKPDAVPSTFPFKNQSPKRKTRVRRHLFTDVQDSTSTLDPVIDELLIPISEEVTILSTSTIQPVDNTLVGTVTAISSPSTTSTQSQTHTSMSAGMYAIERFANDTEALKYLTGFENMAHIMLLYNYLMPTAEKLQHQFKSISPLNQLFLTLIKLRQDKDEYCLALDFDINRQTVAKIITQWINFLYLELKDLNIWLDRKTVDDHFPHNFKKMFPSTRVVLDATEIAIDKPSNVNSQRMTFSTYKNRNTIKTLIGVTPRGQVSYVSDCYGGTTSDRQIIERSELVIRGKTVFCRGDSIMADRGIMVQDLFANHDVLVNTPTTMKGRNQLPASICIKDRRIASKRIHVERVIGYAKTFKILTGPISRQRTNLVNRIVKVCLFLVNFRSCIVGKNA